MRVPGRGERGRFGGRGLSASHTWGQLERGFLLDYPQQEMTLREDAVCVSEC